MPWWAVIYHPLFWIGVIVAVLLLWFLGALFLLIGLGAVESKNRTFGSAMVTVLIGSLLAFFLPWFIGWILYWYIIKVRHDTSWGGAIAAWLLAWIIPLAIVSLVFVFLIVIPGFIPFLPF